MEEIDRLKARIAELEAKTKLLAESEERLALALDGTGLGLWDWNILTDDVTYNNTWSEMIGFTPDETRPTPEAWFSLIHPQDTANVLEEIKKHMTGKTPFYESIYRFKKKDGGWEWMLDRGKVVARDERGKPTRATGTQRIITREKEYEAELRYIADHDSLTQLPNRISLEKTFLVESKIAMRQKKSIALLYLDVDRFKRVNDNLGHLSGDLLLKELAAVIISVLREGEKAYRVGGDEFCVLIPDFKDKEELENLAKRIIQTISSFDLLQGIKIDIGCSIGISLFPENGNSLEEITNIADKAMYIAKAHQENNYCFA